MGAATLESSNSTSLAATVLMPDTAAKLVQQPSVSWRSSTQPLK